MLLYAETEEPGITQAGKELEDCIILSVDNTEMCD